MAWSWRVPFAPSAARIARRNLTVALRQADVEQPVADDARVVVTELLANSLRHAQACSDGGLTVELAVSADDITIAVTDGGSATLPTLIHPPPLAPSGRGLSIVRSLTRRWGIREGGNGNVVFGVLSRA
jgi:anti-sigma regulatory factor (Ser/Thr protein kinase)